MKAYCKFNNGKVMPYTSIDDVKKCLGDLAKEFDDIEIDRTLILARKGIHFLGIGRIISDKES